ncbi:MAG: hypothetical protein ACRCW2_16035 [Cellulosilyticaceae bacterium]
MKSECNKETNKVLPELINYFKEEIIIQGQCIPCEYPDIDKVVKVEGDLCVKDMQLIKNRVGESIEGQKIEGHTLLIQVSTQGKIAYLGIGYAHDIYTITLSGTDTLFVVLPDEINGKPIEALYNEGRVIVTPYMEWIDVEVVDYCQLQLYMMILVDVTFK